VHIYFKSNTSNMHYKTKNPVFLQKISGLIETKRLTSEFAANKKLQLVANLL